MAELFDAEEAAKINAEFGKLKDLSGGILSNVSKISLKFINARNRRI